MNDAPEESRSPENRMLEQRVSRLEEDMRDMKSIFKAIDTRLGSIEMSLARMDGRLEGMEGRLHGMEGRLQGMEGRLQGMEARFAGLPTVWTILIITFTTWAIGSGILIFALNFLKR